MLEEPDFQELFEFTPSALLVLTPDLRIVTASRAYLAVTMTKLDDIRGRALFEVFPENPSDLAANGASIAKASYQKVIETRAPDTMEIFKYDIRRPESEGGGYEVRYWSPVNFPVLDKTSGAVKYIIHRVEDVTEFVKLRGTPKNLAGDRSAQTPQGMDSSFRVTENELRNIRYALDEAAIVAITDRAGNIIHVNKKFCEISKYSAEELLGKNHRIINSRYHPRDFFVAMWKQIASGKVWEGDIRNRAKDGKYYWVHTTIVPMLDNTGKPYQYVSIRYEITEAKLAEEKLQFYAKRLEASNRELQDFASIAAHDLQEPLRKIEAFSDRLKIKYRETLSEDGRDYLDRMMNAARRMRTLIDDLLTYSRVTTKTMPFSPIDLGQIAREVLSDLEVRIEQSKARVDVGELPVIDADPSQMRQLFQNLIANALKFHKKGEAPEVRISASVAGNDCILSIQDKGIGFDEKYLDRIFTIFQRLHGRQEFEGTGVGLAVVRRIVERHSGEITAKSAPDHGATFVITLPVKQAKGEQHDDP